MDVPVKFDDSSSNGFLDIQQAAKPSAAAFSTVFDVDNCQPEVVSYVISGMANQDVGMDVCANFGYF